MPSTLQASEQAASLLARERRQKERELYEAATDVAMRILGQAWRLEEEVIDEVANKVAVDDYMASEAVGGLVLRGVAERNFDGKIRLRST
ncbi:MAG: hypothetical protein ACR2NT_04225 [Acidimicrobiia bacterium]